MMISLLLVVQYLTCPSDSELVRNGRVTGASGPDVIVLGGDTAFQAQLTTDELFDGYIDYDRMSVAFDNIRGDGPIDSLGVSQVFLIRKRILNRRSVVGFRKSDLELVRAAAGSAVDEQSICKTSGLRDNLVLASDCSKKGFES